MEVDWDDLADRASKALAEGRMADAAILFERIAHLVPDAGNNWFNLGFARRGARDFTGALDAYAKALRVGDMAEPQAAHINRAIILKDDLGRNPDARRELRAALKLAPADPDAWFNLGLLNETDGRKDDAREAYRQAIAADALYTPAHARLASLEDDPQRAAAMLVNVLRRGPFTGPRAAVVEFALANALDRAERYDEAFMVATRANVRTDRMRRPEFRYDPAAHTRLVDEIIAAWPSPPAFEASPDDARPVFLCGMFRSGSTLVENLLARHPAIVAGGEIEAIPVMVRERLSPYPAAAASMDEAQRRTLRGEYLHELDRVSTSALHVSDKRSDNFLHIGLIKSLFPGTRLVHTARDPLDIAVSIWFLDFAEPVSYSTDLASIGHYLSQYRRLMAHWEAALGDDIVRLEYEQLVTDPAAQLEPVYRGLGLDPADAGEMIVDRPIRTPSAWAVRGKLHTRSVGRWKNYAHHLEPVRRELGL